MTVLVAFLFILQLVSFFLIAMLYLKLGKVSQLKQEQHAMIRELEDAVGAYLAEIRDENDRLLSGLSRLKPAETTENVQENRPETSLDLPIKPIVPKSKAVNRYKQAAPQPLREERMATKEEQALDMGKKGYSTEEIARILDMGKTEVELLLKFRG